MSHAYNKKGTSYCWVDECINDDNTLDYTKQWCFDTLRTDASLPCMKGEFCTTGMEVNFFRTSDMTDADAQKDCNTHKSDTKNHWIEYDPPNGPPPPPSSLPKCQGKFHGFKKAIDNDKSQYKLDEHSFNCMIEMNPFSTGFCYDNDQHKFLMREKKFEKVTECDASQVFPKCSGEKVSKCEDVPGKYWHQGVNAYVDANEFCESHNLNCSPGKEFGFVCAHACEGNNCPGGNDHEALEILFNTEDAMCIQ